MSKHAASDRARWIGRSASDANLSGEAALFNNALASFAKAPARQGRLRPTYSRKSDKNSERVRASSLNEPRRHEVFITEFCFSTPRIIMQRCFASTTTAT